MAAEFVKRIQLRDPESDFSMFVESTRDSRHLVIGVGKSGWAEFPTIELSMGDAVVLAEHIRRMAVSANRSVISTDSEYPDY